MIPGLQTALAAPSAWRPEYTWPGTAIYIGGAIVVAFIARFVLIRVINRGVSDARRRAQKKGTSQRDDARLVQRTEAMASLLRSVVTVVTFGIAALYVLDALGLDLAPILASAGVGGVALGFGAQSLVKDFLSGVFMILEDQYGVGDVVDTGEVTGTVEEITLRVTRLRDAQGVIWYVRNGEIIRVANKSQGTSTAQVDVPVSSAENPERVIALLREAMSAMHTDPTWSDKLLAAPDVLGVESIVGATMTIRILATCPPGENWAVQRQIRERVVIALNAAGVAGPPLLPGGATGTMGTP